jgi:hypothetical protein
MKKVILAALVIGMAGSISANIPVTPENIEFVTPVGGFVKIVNDTKNDIRIHTGSAHVMLNHGGGSTSVPCEEGRKISYSDGSKATGLIFKIDESMCGKTVKLSEYID